MLFYQYLKLPLIASFQNTSRRSLFISSYNHYQLLIREHEVQLNKTNLNRLTSKYPLQRGISITSTKMTLESDDTFPSSTGSNTSTKPTLTFVTGNKKKAQEVEQILSQGGVDLPFIIVNQKVDLPELQGDPIDIAIEKCKLAAQQVQGPVITEDTSLCFNALNGMPGPYIKWFLEKCGHDGLNRMLVGFDDTSAYAQTVVAFTLGADKEVHVFDGRTDGNIVQPRGPLDFGWDPIFEPNESGGKTYAEMEKSEKNKISHRGRSFHKLQMFLLNMKN